MSHSSEQLTFKSLHCSTTFKVVGGLNYH